MHEKKSFEKFQEKGIEAVIVAAIGFENNEKMQKEMEALLA